MIKKTRYCYYSESCHFDLYSVKTILQAKALRKHYSGFFNQQQITLIFFNQISYNGKI